MRMPNETLLKKWHHFIGGLIVGAIVAYIIFIFMYGQLHKQLLTEKYTLEAEISELESQNERLLQDKQDLDEQANKTITVEKIDISIMNEKDLRIDRLVSHQLIDLIKQDIEHLLGQDIAIVEQSVQLLISTIENKPLTIQDMTYEFTVERLVISSQLKLSVKAKIDQESFSEI